MEIARLFTWELIHYSLLALGIATGAVGGWAAVTGGRGICDLDQEIRPGRFAAGMFLLIAAVIIFGIFQDMRLDHLCAIHGTCQ